LSDSDEIGSKVHHRDIVGLALRRLEQDLKSGEGEQVLRDLKNDLGKS